MKRTVKAWCARWDGGTLIVSYARYTRHLAERVARESWGEDKPKVVPVTITYDDGRKSPPRKRRGGGR